MVSTAAANAGGIRGFVYLFFERDGMSAAPANEERSGAVSR